ncbi:solute carrier family 22 member 10 isoform X25 [Canis lupus familiaris]|uniref:solute carrier family 22 member 10 isoform X25 n=1 Tax=Canis lupus familiaris TaxID=9615 RepID=UPI00005A3784|nr:solute carrier family 22 member 10 isoform X25 [Canis lupus familiaris]XP_038420133.1 solute carrier family 22 member 10 isoform X18 [Canis lupus familiaris]
MAFQELLDQVGDLGKYQILQMVLIFPTLMMLLCQIFLENFTAAIPGHRCWVNILDNDTVSDNDTEILSPDALLRISIPMDSDLRPDKCHRFIHPQWQLLHVNGTFTNMTEPDKETCLDGWVYDQSSFPSTIITEWDLVCSYQSQKSVVQFLFMTGMLVGGLIGGHLSDRWLVEPARWLIINNKPEEGLKALRKVAHINGMKNAGDILTMEGLRSSMQDELEAAQTKTTVCDLFCTPDLRKRICLLLFVRFATIVPFYGITINLQHFGSNIFLFQVVFGALTALVRCLPLLVQNHMGRRTTQTVFMFLVGLSILANTFVPQEMQTLRVALASAGISFAAASSTSFSIHLIELIPTVLRARALGLDTLASRCGAVLAPLLMTLMAYLSILPWIIYGVFPIMAGLAVLLQPETREMPLLDTIHDVKNNKEFSRKVKEINSSVKMTKV